MSDDLCEDARKAIARVKDHSTGPDTARELSDLLGLAIDHLNVVTQAQLHIQSLRDVDRQQLAAHSVEAREARAACVIAQRESARYRAVLIDIDHLRWWQILTAWAKASEAIRGPY